MNRIEEAIGKAIAGEVRQTEALKTQLAEERGRSAKLLGCVRKLQPALLWAFTQIEPYLIPLKNGQIRCPQCDSRCRKGEPFVHAPACEYARALAVVMTFGRRKDDLRI